MKFVETVTLENDIKFAVDAVEGKGNRKAPARW